MSRLHTAPDRAQRVTGPKAAAKLYNDIEYELALGNPDPGDESAGEQALSTLRSRFPGVESAARDVDTPPKLSRRAGASVGGHEGRSRRANPTSSSRRTATTSRGSSAPRPRPTSSSGRGRQAAGTVARQARTYGDRGTEIVTGETASSWGNLALNLVLGGVVLSIFYLLLTKAKGASGLVTGASHVVRAVVSPTVDPLNPKGA